MYEIKGLRAVSLLRASSLHQTDKDNDIPYQRQIVNEFIQKEELNLVKEFVEGAVSGFKVKLEKRDALQTIKKMAENKEFDILVVYKSDRIGRTTDESPFVISFLNQEGIRVITTHNGELKTQTPTDELITWLTFWQNKGESIKISERTSDYHLVLIKEGRYRGGYVPYGYQLVMNGKLNHKQKPIYDFQINPEEAKIVTLIFDLSLKYNMGSKAIAQYLNSNGIKARDNKDFFFSSINHLLKNPIYKGCFHMDSKVRQTSVISEQQPDLVIIPEEIWELNRKTMSGRMKQKDHSPVSAINRKGNALLNGLIYCGSCKKKMHLAQKQARYNKKNGERVIIYYHSYRCQSAYRSSSILCEGQRSYSTKRIDSLIEEEVIEFILALKNKTLTQEFKDNLFTVNNNLTKLKKTKKDELSKKEKQITTLKKEIANALIGDSIFSVEELKESTNLIQKDISDIKKELDDIEDKLVKNNIEIQQFKEIDINTSVWLKKYENSTLDFKKTMINDVIDRIYLYKDKIDIHFNIKWMTFKENCEEGDYGSEKESSVWSSRTITLP